MKFRETLHGHQVIYAYDIRDGPDARARVDDRYSVDLWKGIFHDEVRVYRDIGFPPLVGRRRCRHGKGRGEALHAEMLNTLCENL